MRKPMRIVGYELFLTRVFDDEDRKEKWDGEVGGIRGDIFAKVTGTM